MFVPTPNASRHDHNNNNNPPADSCSVFKMRIFGIGVIFLVCMYTWISKIFEFMDKQHAHGRWTLTDASVVGVNSTLRNESYAATYYCARLNYETTTGQNITVLSHNECYRSKKFALDLVGSDLQVRYDPWEPENFIEQSEFENDMTLLTLVIFCGIFLTLFFGFILGRIITTGQNNEEEGQTSGDVEQAIDPVVAQMEREKLIRSKFYFLNVSNDLSNLDIGSIRSPPLETCTTTTSKENEETEEIDEEVGGKSSETEPQNDASSLPSPPSTLTATSAPSLFCSYALSSITSSWRRPAGVPECCICLEEYQANEMICAAKTTDCNHVFHQECVTGWLMAGHDQCPLCRINLLKDQPTGP